LSLDNKNSNKLVEILLPYNAIFILSSKTRLYARLKLLVFSRLHPGPRQSSDVDRFTKKSSEPLFPVV
jgi:hypothetical protein